MGRESDLVMDPTQSLLFSWLGPELVLSDALPLGIQQMVLVCLSISVVLFDTYHRDLQMSQYLNSVASSSLAHYGSYPFSFQGLFIDRLGNLHEDQTNSYFSDLAGLEDEGLDPVKLDLNATLTINLLLTVKMRYFCCHSLSSCLFFYGLLAMLPVI